MNTQPITRDHKTLEAMWLLELLFSHQSSLYLDSEVAPQSPRFHICDRCSQLYRLSTQRLNIDMKPKEVLIEAVNKLLKEKLKEKGFVFSDSQLKFRKS